MLLGKGDGGFAPAVKYPGGGSTLVAADFNGDGKLDLASLGNNVSVLMGRGDGTFQAPVSSLWGKTYGYLGFADLNHDGKLDLLIADRDASSMVEMLGNGDGTFQARQEYLVSAKPTGSATSTALAVADLNGDGKLDVIAVLFASSGSSQGQIAVLLGNGDGTFQAPILTSTSTAPPMIAVADVNGDGTPDLLLADCCGLSEASLLIGNGDGTFQAELQFPSGPDPKGIAVADFNGDGKPDAAIIGQVATTDRGTLAVVSFYPTSFSATGAAPVVTTSK